MWWLSCAPRDKVGLDGHGGQIACYCCFGDFIGRSWDVRCTAPSPSLWAIARRLPDPSREATARLCSWAVALHRHDTGRKGGGVLVGPWGDLRSLRETSEWECTGRAASRYGVSHMGGAVEGSKREASKSENRYNSVSKTEYSHGRRCGY